jgi:hypothetical protein
MRWFLAALISAIAPAPVLAQAPAASGPDPAQVERSVGPWELSNPAGDRKCAVTFKPERLGAGRALALSDACATTFPGVAGMVAWTISPAGGIRWTDRAGTTVFDFDETEVGIFESLRPGDSNVYFLTNLGLAGTTLPTAEEVMGMWTLGQPRGRALCALTLKQELAADAGPLEQRFALDIAEGCERSVAALNLSHWRLSRELLVLGGRGAAIIAFKREPDGRWVKTPVDTRPLVMTRQ